MSDEEDILSLPFTRQSRNSAYLNKYALMGFLTLRFILYHRILLTSSPQYFREHSRKSFSSLTLFTGKIKQLQHYKMVIFTHIETEGVIAKHQINSIAILANKARIFKLINFSVHVPLGKKKKVNGYITNTECPTPVSLRAFACA